MDPSTSVVHRALAVDEILTLIMGSLFSFRFRTLASLARTCKMLNEAAIPLLWQTLYSLSPLLRLLPPGAVTEGRDEQDRIILIVAQQSNLDWTRFDHYARHVHDLHRSSPADFSADSLAVLFALHPPAQPPLPQLRTLNWVGSLEEHSCLVRYLLTPTLKCLRFDSFDIPESDVISLMEDVRAVCRGLKCLVLHFKTRDGPMCRIPDVLKSACISPDWLNVSLLPLLRDLPELQTYKAIWNMTAPRVEALAMLPQLTTLHLSFDFGAIEAVTARLPVPQDVPFFPALKTLFLAVDELDEHANVFLGAIQSPALQVLVLYAEKQPTAAELHDSLAVIARAPYRYSLTTLQLDTPVYDHGGMGFDVGDAIYPLYALPGIRTLIFRGFIISAGPDTLRDIAHAWPKLEVLALCCIPLPQPMSGVPRVTLADLVPFALQCPRLRALALEIHDATVPDAAAIAQLLPTPSRHALQILAVHNAPDVDAHQAAAFLARLFPELRDLRHSSSADFIAGFEIVWVRIRPDYDWMRIQHDYQDKWAMVDDLLAGRATALPDEPLDRHDVRDMQCAEVRPFVVRPRYFFSFDAILDM
ncbi:uncharacterized protein TRAVEDRAFT_22243 [Trametes versicolor FP-101664 SS1]|uniref:uncharacterized protein n=1 Tax=Trametes versicolor (strain FP-101664) TaxID=717944 RepID=UPI0004623605|nr:uncharacterized protein TRAVEDRAFT_22243 [Trametes versicolor FP-101664 SS1]EIW55805.1 hypothetical protein TRAVEDRAFT_22243 [Trametes versicolor FP-101664 SS1]